MSTFQVNYIQVTAEVQRLRRHITSNITNTVNSEYRQMQSQLSQADGEANVNMQNATELNRQKSIATANTIESLLRFISDYSRQLEIEEQQIARTFANAQIIRRGDS